MSQQADSHAVIVAGDIEPEVHQAVLQLDGPAGLKGFPGIVMITDREGRILEATEAAAALRAGLQEDASGLLAGLVIRAQDEGPLYEPVSLSDGTPYDLAILPLGRGGALVIGRCSSIERNLRDALIDSRQRYKDFVECSSDFAWETDALGNFVFVSPKGALGYAASELSGRRARDYIHSRNDDSQPLPFLSPVARERVRTWMRAADGAATLIATSCIPLYDVSGRWTGARGVCRDITQQWDRDRALAKVRQRERLVNGLVDSIRDSADHEELLGHAARTTGEALDARSCVIYRTGAKGALRFAAKHGEALDEALACALSEAVNRPGVETGIMALSLGDDEVMMGVTRHRRGVNGALCVVRALGQEPWNEDDRGLMASVAGQLGVAIEQIAIHESLLAQSLTDELTGLNNRRAFMEALRSRFGQAMRSGRSGSLLYIDLDNFKRVNDVHGHQRGDQVLQDLANILSSQTRVNDVVARLGGDEFGLWLDEVGQTDAVTKAAELLEASAVLEAHSGDAEHLLSVSIGIAAFDPNSGESLEELIARADAAMYQAKETGKASCAVAPPAAAETQKEQDQ